MFLLNPGNKAQIDQKHKHTIQLAYKPDFFQIRSIPPPRILRPCGRPFGWIHTAYPEQHGRVFGYVKIPYPFDRLVMGIRRSFPSARGVIFTPGGAWRRLYSLPSTSFTTRRTTSSGYPAAAISATLRSSPTYIFRIGASGSYSGSESESFWPGRSSADGGLVSTRSGITSRPRLLLYQRDTRYTIVLKRSLITAKPPAMSP